MKLATLHDGSRDGQLVVVSRDLASAHLASHIAGTLQRVLDDWNFLSPQLEDLYAVLNGGKARHAFAFDPRACLAPLPRAYLWAPAGAGLARSDLFLRPTGATRLAAPRPGLATVCRVQVVAMTGDVAAKSGADTVKDSHKDSHKDADKGADKDSNADTALDSVRLLLLAATWQAGDAVLASAFCPVALTPEELGTAWAAGRVASVPSVRRQGAALALAASPADAAGFGPRIAALAQGEGLGAGSLIGGPAFDAGPGWLPGQRLQLHLQGPDGTQVFGAMDVHSPQAAAAEESEPEPEPEPAAQDGSAR